MERRARRWRRRSLPVLTGGLALIWLVAGTEPAAAQSELGRGAGGSVAYPYGTPAGGGSVYRNANVGGGSPGAASGGGMYGNPYAVPSMNPFLNPYASMYAPASTQNAALYFFAAQQSMGGIGSGQISGTRPRPSAAPAPAPTPSDRRASDIPGGGAARYFPQAARRGTIPDSHYNRYGSYYSANGH